jgi:hypothetical protein
METIGEVARQRLTSLPLVAPGRGNESREGGGELAIRTPTRRWATTGWNRSVRDAFASSLFLYVSFFSGLFEMLEDSSSNVPFVSSYGLVGGSYRRQHLVSGI